MTLSSLVSVDSRVLRCVCARAERVTGLRGTSGGGEQEGADGEVGEGAAVTKRLPGVGLLANPGYRAWADSPGMIAERAPGSEASAARVVYRVVLSCLIRQFGQRILNSCSYKSVVAGTSLQGASLN